MEKEEKRKKKNMEEEEEKKRGGGEGKWVLSPPLGLLLWNCRGWPKPVGLVQWKSTIRTLHSVIPSSLKRIESQLKSSQVQALPFAEIIIRLPNNMRAENARSDPSLTLHSLHELLELSLLF